MILPSETPKSTNLPRSKSRYRTLTLFVALFVTGIVSVLTTNMVMSAKFKTDAVDISLAARQRVLVERIGKTLLNAKLTQQGAPDLDVNKALVELGPTVELFEGALDAFDKGGTIIGIDGESTYVSAAKIEDARDAIDWGKMTWSGYSAELHQLINSDRMTLRSLAKATRIALATNESLLAMMVELSHALDSSQSPGNQATLLHVKLAERQQMLTQRITKSLIETSLVRFGSWGGERSLQELRKSVELFNTTIDAFDEGGTVIDSHDNSIDLKAIEDQQSRVILAKARDAWQPLKDVLFKVLESNSDAIRSLDTATQKAIRGNPNVIAHMNDLTTALDADFNRRSTLLQRVQLSTIAFSLLMFGVLFFGFIRQLKTRDVELARSKGETDQILATVNDGLFLLDRNLSIGHQHSSSLMGIMREESLADANFLTVLSRIVPVDVADTSKDYLSLLFEDKTNEALVASLNPLDEIEAHFPTDSGQFDVGYLSFNFKRIHANGRVSHLLVQVDDVTEKVSLERQLVTSTEQAQEQFQLLTKVLHVEPGLMVHFLNETDKALELINSTLEWRSDETIDHQRRIELLFRTMHSVKGDAAGLDLTLFVEKAHDFETVLETLRNNSHPNGNDFIPLAVKLNDFMRHVSQLRDVIANLGVLTDAINHSDSNAANTVEKSEFVSEESTLGVNLINEEQLVEYATRVAKEHNKAVELVLSGEEYLPDACQTPIKNILNQLIVNSIVHGIEYPQEREKAGKRSAGSLSSSIQPGKNNGVELIFRDDGRGLCESNLKATALKKGICDSDELSSLSRTDCLDLIFLPGFSSAERLDSNSGRGVGMDIVLSTVEDLGGSVRVESVEGEYCEFQIWLSTALEKSDEDLQVA